MALAEQTNSSSSVQSAANTPLQSKLVTTPPTIERKSAWGSLILAFIAGAVLTAVALYTIMLEPLQKDLAFQTEQKLSYIANNRIDQSTFEPRIRALEMSNSAKAEKEAILVNTIENLRAELAKTKSSANQVQQ